MKKVFTLLALFAITASANAQLKVNSNGLVTIYAQTQDWQSALRVHVPTKSSCAYHLYSYFYNKDVFFVCGEGYASSLKPLYVTSDIEFKKNITPIKGALKKVLSLQGVRYQYIDEDDDGNKSEFHLGFIAQDVEAIFPEAVKDMPDNTKAMSYTDLIAVLVEAIKEQQMQIENLSEQIAACCQGSPNYLPPKDLDNNDGQEEVEMGYDNSSTDENTLHGIEKAKLFQNTPNPFSVNTEISFDIPDNSTSAKLLIHDMQGAELKSYVIATKGNGQVIIQGSELPAGMYMYTLLVNNRIVDTKKMILTK